MIEYVYVLRCCHEDMTSYGNFVWPESGPVECSDWDPKATCGNGLHGWLWGDGNVDASGPIHRNPSAKWLIVRVAKDEIVDLHGKVKFPRGFVEFCGPREDATSKMLTLVGAGRAVMYSNVTAGHCGTATAGDYGTATVGFEGTATVGHYGRATASHYGTATAGDCGTAMAGNCGKATAGYIGTATAGDGGTATAGDCGTATAGYMGKATAGEGGKATAGNGGTATAGIGGTATAGDYGTATAGNRGTASAGDYGAATVGVCGTATVGYGGIATAGHGGTLVIRWPDTTTRSHRTAIGNVGEDGIEANVAYVVRDGKLVRKDSIRD